MTELQLAWAVGLVFLFLVALGLSVFVCILVLEEN